MRKARNMGWRRGGISPAVVAWGVLVALLVGGARAMAVPAGTVIRNTAVVSFRLPSGVPVQASSNAVRTQVRAPGQAALTAGFVPDVVRPGGRTQGTITITNTGGAPLAGGRLVLTPPAGVTVAPRDPYTILPDGSIEIRPAAIAPGGHLALALDMQVPPGTPSGTLALGVQFTANGTPPVDGQATLRVQDVFTPARLAFMARDPATGTLVPADSYHAGQDIYVQVTDPDQNLDPTRADRVTVTLTVAATGDRETLTLVETGPNTGVFVAGVPSTAAPARAGDGRLSVAQDAQIRARYQDRFHVQDLVALAAMVDPFGLVFDATSGQPVNGVRVTLVDAVTGKPAQVFADDGVTPYPATITTGATVTDAAGRVYTFGPGQYRFPFVRPGTYRLQVVAPAGWRFPSQTATGRIQQLPGAPFAIAVGSRGEVFRVNPGPALHIDVPLDPVATGLFVSKQALVRTAGIGDAVGFVVTVDNPSAAQPATGVELVDVLPPGFRYVRGSARVNDRPAADPRIDADGRTLHFLLGTLAAAGAPSASVRVRYLARPGPNAHPGLAYNTAFAIGRQGGAAVRSNTTRAGVVVREDVFRTRGTVVGRVFVDDGGAGRWGERRPGADDEFNEPGERGVPGVRVYLEDGRYAVTDPYGFYHFEAVPPGGHVVRLDLDSVPRRYRAAPMNSARFAGRATSQFVDVTGGQIARADFRLVWRKPPASGVRVGHRLTPEDGRIVAHVQVVHDGRVPLARLEAVYVPPAGWHYIEETARVDGETQAPRREGERLVWKLDPTRREHEITLALVGDGEGGDKQARAWARFAVAGGRQGRTPEAAVAVHDEIERIPVQIRRELHLHFGTRRADLNEARRAALDRLVQDLAGLEIRAIEVIGHTDNVPIAPEHRREFPDNQALSEARARAVAEYLRTRLGLGPEQVHARGMGARQPVAPNTSEAGRARNRRTEIRIEAVRERRRLVTELGEIWARADAEALGSWDETPVGRRRLELHPAAAPPSPSDVDAWLARVRPGETRWLYPEEGLSPAVPAVHVLIAHPPHARVELRLNGKPVNALHDEGERERGGRAVHHWRNVHLVEGENRFEAVVRDAQGREIARLVRTVVYAGAPVVAEWVRERSQAVADGEHEPVIAVRFLDRRGQAARPGMTGIFRVDPPYEPATRRGPHDWRRAQEGRFTIGKDGVAFVRLAPTTRAGEAVLRFRLANGERIVRAWIQPAGRSWILVGFAEGTAGFNRLKGAMQPLGPRDKDGFWRDGRLAFYAKGRVKGETLLTIAYDTAKTQRMVGGTHAQAVDPNAWYLVYGDASEQRFDAPSSHKLYVKLERETFYALYGDFDTGLSVVDLARYSRRLTGLKSEWRGEHAGYTGFVARTSRAHGHDEFQGDGTSGLYRLARGNILVGSERVHIETRDRYHPEHVLDSRQLAPHLDYDMDYLAGTIFFKQPVPAHDANLNPVFIVVDYEADDRTAQFTTAGGRAYVRPWQGVELGLSAVNEGRPGRDDRMLAADVRLHPTPTDEVRAEVARSDRFGYGRRHGWKIEATHEGERLRARIHAQDVSDGFGLGQTTGAANGMRSQGVEAEWRLDPRWRVGADAQREDARMTGATRTTAGAYVERRDERLSARLGVREARERTALGTRNRSRLGTLGLNWQATARLGLRARREQLLGGGTNVRAWPTRTLLGMDYRLAESTTLDLTQEWTQGTRGTTQTTRVGARSQIWRGASLTAGYEERTGESGRRAVATAGLEQRIIVSEALSLDFGVDRVKTLHGPATLGFNPNGPIAVGAAEDYTAYSFGVGYAPKTWLANLRLERRLAATSRRWGGMASLMGRPLEALMAELRVQGADDRFASGDRLTQFSAAASFAWRPQEDGLVLLDRLEARLTRRIQAGMRVQGWRYINNLAANWKPAAGWELRADLGLKWTREQVDPLSLDGRVALVGAQVLHDLDENWLLGAQVARLAAMGMRLDSYGLALDRRLVEDLLLGIGYNFRGFYDPDFVASRYTIAGPYLRLRLKFDETDLGNVLDGF